MKPRITKPLLFLFIAVLFHSASAQTWKELYLAADSLSDLEMVEKLPIALELATASLEKAEKLFGHTDTNVARVLELVAQLLESGSKTSMTIRLCKRVMIVDLLENGSGRPEKALPYAERALAIREKVLGRDHVEVAKSLQLIASIYFIMGNGKECRPLVERALSIYEKAHATVGRDYAFALHNMGFMYYLQGDYQNAGTMFSRAIEKMRIFLHPGEPDLTFTLTLIGVSYWSLGLYNEAEEPLKEALKICQQIYGPESATSARRMGNLASLYELQGKFSEAVALIRQSFALAAKGLAANDPLLGRAFLGMGSSLMLQGKYSDAVDTFQRAIALWKQNQSPEPRLILTLQMIGECHLSEQKYAQAEAVFLSALSVQDSLLGLEPQGNTSISLALASSLGLANIYMRTGRFRAADSLLQRSLTAREHNLGPDNPDVADVLDVYSSYYRMVDDMPNALRVSQRAVAIRAKNFLRNGRTMSEKDALTFSMFLRRSVNNFLSSVIDSRSSDAAIGKQVADIIISTKGQTTEQAIKRRKALVTETDSATLALAEEYRYSRFQLSTLYVEGPAKRKPEEFRHQVDSLENAANELEASLARRSQSFAATQHKQNINIDEIASHLPQSSTLAEYLRINYVKLNPDTLIPRYIALTVDGAGQSRIVDLGEADKIDNVIEQYQRHFAGMAKVSRAVGPKEEAEYKAIATQLHTLVWQPLESNIKDSTNVFIAPDGGLNLISFAGLIGKDGKYLIEKHPLHCLSAGRDVLRLNETRTSATGLLAFGDPDYDATVAERMTATPQLAANLTPINPYQVRNVRSGCELLNEMTVTRLYNTRTEAEAITNFWRHGNNTEFAQALVGARASEERFKQESMGKRVIHIATHGYFLQSSCMPTTRDNTVVGENPLLQSGLLLAGANLHGKGAKEVGAEDGIVTALEVSAMDLRGTDLVVLSACETGLGKVEQGEGVYGLRRAFQMAGAKTVVSSLWQVPDNETMKFMKTLYSTKAKTYPELVQQVALQRIKEARLRGRPTHPFTWGAFVATGDWRVR